MRGFARGFTIAPLSAASLAPLREDEVRMGSALLSLNRGIASASSVALAATIFQNRLGTRTLVLTQDQSATAFGQEAMLQTLTTTFERLGDISQIAGMKALAMLHRLVTMEAALHSYHDMFLLVACISAAGIIPALWIGKRRVAAPLKRPGDEMQPAVTSDASAVPRSP
jgi:DHA2 family multidrug resistance protein